MHAYAAALAKSSPAVMVRMAALLVAIASLVGCGREARPARAPLLFTACADSVPAPVAADADGGGKRPMVLRLDAHLPDFYALSAVCLRVDRQRVYVRRLETPAAIRSRVDIPVNLRPGTSHAVELVAEYHGARDYKGYKFLIHSIHSVTPDVPAGVLGVHIFDRGGADTPIEQRAAVERSEPSDPQPTGLPDGPNGGR